MKRLVRRIVTRFEDVVSEGLTRYEAVSSRRPSARTARLVHELAQELIGHEPVEVFIALTLDSKNRVTGAYEVSRGTLSASLVHPREVFGAALRIGNVAALVVAHNHPSGDPAPSVEDDAVTERLIAAGRVLGVPLLDHVVIGQDSSFSYRQSRPNLFS